MSIKDILKRHQITVDKLAVRQRKLAEEELQNIRRASTVEIISGTTGKQLKDNLRSFTNNFVNKALDSLLFIAEKESIFVSKHLKNAKSLTKQQLEKTILEENMRLNLASQEKVRKSISTAYKQFGNRKADEIAQIIKDGRTLGLSNIEIMKNVDERINGLHTTQAKVLSHTSTLYVSNVAQRETIKTVSEKVEFVLGDSQEHTDICLGLEGQIFDAQDAPTPPLHWGCNSYLVPVSPESD